MDNFLQEEVSFLRKELNNKQKVIDNLINLLNGVNTKRDETNFSCKSLQIKNSSENLAILMKRSVLIDFQLLRTRKN